MSEVMKYEGDRKVSFIDRKVSRWLREDAAEMEDGLCLARFHADYEVAGAAQWQKGDIVTVDGMKFEVTMTGKRCFPECVLLQRTGTKCPLALGVAFGHPVEGDL